MSVPVWGVTLSGPLSVVALVSHYLTSQLMERSPLLRHLSFPQELLILSSVRGISTHFCVLSPGEGQVSYGLLTRTPLSAHPKTSFAFDLHVLGTPPAFILSQDQTLHQ